MGTPTIPLPGDLVLWWLAPTLNISTQTSVLQRGQRPIFCPPRGHLCGRGDRHQCVPCSCTVITHVGRGCLCVTHHSLPNAWHTASSR